MWVQALFGILPFQLYSLLFEVWLAQCNENVEPPSVESIIPKYMLLLDDIAPPLCVPVPTDGLVGLIQLSVVICVVGPLLKVGIIVKSLTPSKSIEPPPVVSSAPIRAQATGPEKTIRTAQVSDPTREPPKTITRRAKFQGQESQGE
jgi:hypothetical protein